jgi:hypothetical protein
MNEMNIVIDKTSSTVLNVEPKQQDIFFSSYVEASVSQN